VLASLHQQVDYRHDRDWNNWNLAAKKRILLNDESNLNYQPVQAPPLVEYCVSLRQVSGSVTQVSSIGSDNSKFSSQGSSRTQDSYTTSTTILGRMREDGEAQAREDARRQQEDEQSEEETEYMGVQEDMSINIEYQQEQEPVPAVSVNSKTLQKAADAGSKKSREVRSYGR
jgi:hypothetical protein